ncbi:MAG: hypothetical protein HY396_01710 [Candidatus Doudnabacteria bacterium]|nr:hypothetical protein [Candidatus Doudnabacteria bacterium]
MIIKLLVQILFYGLMMILAFYSLLMVYVLLRFGKSKVLGLVLSAFYLILITSLYAAAIANFNQISFPKI